MASAAILRSAARSLRLRQPLCQQGWRSIDGLSPSTRLLSSFVPTERQKCFPSSDVRSKDHMEQTKSATGKKEEFYERLSMKIDKLSDLLDEQKRLLDQLEVQMKERHDGAIDLTPWVVSFSASFFVFALYNYVKG